MPSECNDFTRTVEIHFEKDECKPILTNISFPFDPNVSHESCSWKSSHFFYGDALVYVFQDALREEMTEQVRWNVNRDSMEDKQTGLLSLMPALKRDIVHQV